MSFCPSRKKKQSLKGKVEKTQRERERERERGFTAGINFVLEQRMCWKALSESGGAPRGRLSLNTPSFSLLAVNSGGKEVLETSSTSIYNRCGHLFVIFVTPLPLDSRSLPRGVTYR
jgi:hypothetical protein